MGFKKSKLSATEAPDDAINSIMKPESKPVVSETNEETDDEIYEHHPTDVENEAEDRPTSS